MRIWWRTQHPALSVLLLLYFLLHFAKVNLATTNTLLLLGFLSNESFSSLGVYFTDLKPSWLRVTVRPYLLDFAAPKSFHLTKLKKHGSTSLLTAVHHPPLDTTVWMDISRNPGPISEIISNGWELRLKEKLSWTMDKGCCLIFLH